MYLRIARVVESEQFRAVALPEITVNDFITRMQVTRKAKVRIRKKGTSILSP